MFRISHIFYKKEVNIAKKASIVRWWTNDGQKKKAENPKKTPFSMFY